MKSLSGRGMERFCNRIFLLTVTVGYFFKSTVQYMEIEAKVPSKVVACLGSEAAINCTFKPERLKVHWFFRENKTLIHGEHYEIMTENTSSVLTIKNVTLNDSGEYFCRVFLDIPVLKEKTSEKCDLCIKSIDDSTPESNQEWNTTTGASTFCTTKPSSYASSDWLVWTASALGCVLVVIATAIIWCIFRRSREIPIYENTMKTAQRNRSPRLAMQAEKGKMCKQTDTLKSHSYTSRPKGRQLYQV